MVGNSVFENKCLESKAALADKEFLNSPPSLALDVLRGDKFRHLPRFEYGPDR